MARRAMRRASSRRAALRRLRGGIRRGSCFQPFAVYAVSLYGRLRRRPTAGLRIHGGRGTCFEHLPRHEVR